MGKFFFFKVNYSFNTMVYWLLDISCFSVVKSAARN